MTYLVVNWASRAFDGDVGAKVEIELEGMGAAGLYQSTRKRVAVPVPFSGLREEANVVPLAGNDDSELGNFLATQLLEAFLHIVDFLLENGCILSL